MPLLLQPFSLDRMESAVAKVKERLLRAAAALDAAGIQYAVAGGNAIGLWVSRVDEAAVRNTVDVHVLVRRPELPAIKVALSSVGFVYRHSAGLDSFLDGAGGKVREAVHLIFANEKVREHEPVSNPDVIHSERGPGYQVLSLEPLVQIKLTAFRDKDRTHLRDLIEVGLVDASWPARFPDELGSPLRSLLDTPDG